MKQITSITNDSKQTLAIVLDDGSRVRMDLKYIDSQAGWFYSISYGTFASNNRRLVNSPNMIRQFRGIIPFGLACLVTDGYEPVYLDDFTSGRVTLFVLNPTDIDETESLITETLPNFNGYPLV